MAVTGPEPWLVSWNTPRTARTLLLCLPHPGSGAQQFRHWPESLGPRVALLAVRIPGRESRLQELPATKMNENPGQLIPAPSARRDLWYLWGHNMGALLSHEVTVALGTHQGWPRHFITSAPRAPHRQSHGSGSAELGDHKLAAQLIAQGSVPVYVGRTTAGPVLHPAITRRPGCPRRLRPCPVEGWREEAD
ncbi:thioesterase domain-containing protein [Streptomyces sp. NPDC026589]|uniref:thioesterase II family protein n=1 Tax=Streptomyces sp. NPDC026589 TaxID=3155609 RepID=UPI0034051B43